MEYISVQSMRKSLFLLSFFSIIFGLYLFNLNSKNWTLQRRPTFLDPVGQRRNPGNSITYKELLKANELYNDNAVELQKRLQNATEKKIILSWYPMFGMKTPQYINDKECGNCEFTYDRERIKDPFTAAVIFHFHEIAEHDIPPLESRNPNQLYIFWTMESPPSLRLLRGRTLQFENNYKFNATMSYRLDSDFMSPYGEQRSKKLYYKEKLQNNLENILKFKSKTALTLVSNCGATPATSRRLQILNEVIDLGFDLDARGSCFFWSASFPRGNEQQEATKKYKFYFSFENSYHCRDYITEKFFYNALDVSAVPVVRGATKEDYEAIAPPGSFIHYDDFNSTEELVKYLNYLDKNDTAYLEYFKWYELEDDQLPFHKRITGFCQVCRALHGIYIDDVFKPNFIQNIYKERLFTNGTLKKAVTSLSNWFHGDNEPECLNQT